MVRCGTTTEGGRTRKVESRDAVPVGHESLRAFECVVCELVCVNARQRRRAHTCMWFVAAANQLDIVVIVSTVVIITTTTTIASLTLGQVHVVVSQAESQEHANTP